MRCASRMETLIEERTDAVHISRARRGRG
jgi:hypothetical protein